MNHLSLGNDEFEKNSKKKIVLEHFSDVVRKNVLQYVPGLALFDDMINFDSEVHKKRVSKFMENLYENILLEFGSDFDFEDLKNESFNDLLQRILNKVKNTQSEFKKDRFRDILLLQISTKSEDYIFEKFVELLDRLNDLQIIILKELSEKEQFTFGVGSHKSFTIIESYIKECTENYISNDFIDFLKNYAKKEKNAEIEFYLAELLALGLIKNAPQKVQLGSTNTPKYIVSDICQEFISFIIKK